MRFFITSRRDKEEALKVAVEAARYIRERGGKVCVDSYLSTVSEFKQGSPGEEEYDIVVAVGGDGTMLQAQHMINEKETPLLGIRVGGYGVLTAIDKGEVKTALNRILRGDYETFSVRKLRVYSHRGVPDAVNEYLLLSWGRGKAGRFRVYADGFRINSFIGDGVIIATSLGSFAYSYSACKCLVHPSIKGLIVTALEPWPPSLEYPYKSIVLGECRVKVETQRPGLLMVDGRKALENVEKVEIGPSPVRARFVTFSKVFPKILERLAHDMLHT